LYPQISRKFKTYYIFLNRYRIKFVLFTQNWSLSSQKYGLGIRDPEKTYTGSRGQKVTGSATLELFYLVPRYLYSGHGAAVPSQDLGVQVPAQSQPAVRTTNINMIFYTIILIFYTVSIVPYPPRSRNF
jgi:hypothetical protein